jgi:hypothetical protein
MHHNKWGSYQQYAARQQQGSGFHPQCEHGEEAFS